MQLSVIVPAYNEEAGLEQNIRKYNDYLMSRGFGYEIIIVNDGSNDKTEEIANRLSNESEKIKTISLECNRGKGAAVRTGLLAGSGDHLLFLDADNATSIDHIEKAWPLFEAGYDLVIGSRSKKDAPGAEQVISQNYFKRTIGIFGNMFIRLITGSKIHDTQCGFKMMTRKARDIIIPKTKTDRWAIDVEILELAKEHGLKIGIIPVKWHCGPTSRVGIKGYFVMLWEILKIKFR